MDKATSLLSGSERGTQSAIVFALVAERLTAFYDHGHWLSKAQGATLCADWLTRSKRTMPMEQRKHLSELSDQLARKIADSLTREAGLYTAHEMMESLSQNNLSEVGRSLMDECVRLIAGEAA
ncbi:MAG: hypothetical protein WC073_02940 [Sterolibacterium sp.]